jgi:hypothetical protein
MRCRGIYSDSPQAISVLGVAGEGSGGGEGRGKRTPARANGGEQRAKAVEQCKADQSEVR